MQTFDEFIQVNWFVDILHYQTKRKMSNKTHVRYRLYGIDIIETTKSGFNYSVYVSPVHSKLIGKKFASFELAKQAAEKRIDQTYVR